MRLPKFLTREVILENCDLMPQDLDICLKCQDRLLTREKIPPNSVASILICSAQKWKKNFNQEHATLGLWGPGWQHTAGLLKEAKALHARTQPEGQNIQMAEIFAVPTCLGCHCGIYLGILVASGGWNVLLRAQANVTWTDQSGVEQIFTSGNWLALYHELLGTDPTYTIVEFQSTLSQFSDRSMSDTFTFDSNWLIDVLSSTSYFAKITGGVIVLIMMPSIL